MEEGNSDVRQRKIKKVERSRDLGESFSRDRISNFVLPDYFGYGLIFVFLILIKVLVVYENTVPHQLKLKDADSYPDRFIGERAELQLKRLTDLGPRVVGSYENEVLAVDFLKREISFITQESSKIHNIEVDIQKPTGSYYLFLKPYAFRNCYANIQNIVVKLSSSSTQSTNSVLLNCHYDTVPESPGASDNGLNCVVMLEILRVMSKSPKPLKNNIIFLFNGAEESPLQASHGYISQHKWSKEVKVVINLDSAGAGGREVLFQTSGEPWLVEAYSKAAPLPTGGVQAEELFHSGVIPSDTDFRIFRDFGGVPGFDFAHITNGYIYHTKFDKMEFIKSGVYQHTGDNILALVRELANIHDLGKIHLRSRTRIVYTDVFNLFMVVYSEDFAVILNLATVLVSLGATLVTMKRLPCGSRFSIRSLFVSAGDQLLGLLFAGAIIVFVSKTLGFYKATMSWYLRPWLIIPLYVFPLVFSVSATLLLVQRYTKRDSLENSVIRYINGAQVLWTISLFVGTLAGIRTSFFLLGFTLFPSVASVCVTFSRNAFTVKNYLIAYGISLLFPVLFVLHMKIRVFMTIIPMAGRMGPHTNPEMVIGALAFLSAVLLLQIIPLLLLMRGLKKFLIALCVVHIVTMAAVIGTDFGFPYDGNVKNPALQRFYLVHCERTFHDDKGSVRKADSGFFIQGMDHNNLNYVSKVVPEWKEANSVAQDCDSEVFCGFPVYTSRFIRPAPYSYWIPADPPTIHHPTTLEVVNQTQISIGTRRIRISITGPDHVSVGISPRGDVKLMKWSFDRGLPIEIEKSHGRKTYMVYYTHGLMGATLEIDLDLEIPKGKGGSVMDVAVIGHYMHDRKYRTNEFKNLISKFPEWSHLTPWTATYTSWVI